MTQGQEGETRLQMNEEGLRENKGMVGAGDRCYFVGRWWYITEGSSRSYTPETNSHPGNLQLVKLTLKVRIRGLIASKRNILVDMHLLLLPAMLRRFMGNRKEAVSVNDRQEFNVRYVTTDSANVFPSPRTFPSSSECKNLSAN